MYYLHLFLSHIQKYNNMSRLEKTQTIELSRMDAQPTTTSSRQGSNSSHTSSEHNLIENQPQRPNRRRHRNGEGAGSTENTGDAEFHANNLGGSGPGSRRQNPPNSARIAGQVPEDMGKLFFLIVVLI